MSNLNTDVNDNNNNNTTGETPMKTETAATTAYVRGQQAATAHLAAAKAIRKALNAKTEETIATKTETAMKIAAIATGKDLAFKQPEKQDLESLLDAHYYRGQELLERKQSRVLKNYRNGYQDTICASGSKSKNNGDPVALALAGLEAWIVIATAEILLDMTTGELAAKYGHLNEGQKRMNSGNRIRNGFKKGLWNETAIEAAIATASLNK